MAAGSPEIVFPAAQQVTGGGRILPAPSSFYVTGADRLRIVSANSRASVAVQLHWRLANVQGEIIANRVDHVPHTDRSVNTTDHELGSGQLLNATIFVNSGASLIGQTYVMVQLVRGMGLPAIVLGTLLGGYVTATQALGFPGSPIQSSIEGGGVARFIQGTNPGAGVQVLETVPTGARWELITIGAQFTTSGTVAVRRPRLGISSGGVILVDNYHPGTLPASSSAGFAWAQGMALASAFAAASNYAGLPRSLPLLAGDTVGIDAENFQPGDDWGAPSFYVREWLEV